MHATCNSASSDFTDRGVLRQGQGKRNRHSATLSTTRTPKPAQRVQPPPSERLDSGILQNPHPLADPGSARLSPSLLNTVEVRQLRISYTAFESSMGIDGSASLSDARSPIESALLNDFTTSLKLSQAERRSAPRRTGRGRPINMQKRSSESSQIQSRHEQFVKGTAIGPRSGKPRLPWLDGSRSRQGSVPTVPGAFHDEKISAEPKSTIPPQHDEKPSTEPKLTEQHPAADIAHESPLVAPTLPQVPPTEPQNPVSQRPNTSTKAGLADGNSNQPATQSGQASAAVKESDLHLNSTTQESSKDLPPAPLIAMARELYRTDSSAFSESDASMKGGRQRALDDAMPSVPIKPALAVQPAQFKDSPSNIDDQPSPKAQVGPEFPMNLLSSGAPPSAPVDAPSSMTVQPIRSKKVTMTVDDLPKDQSRRNHSISLQPIKARTATRTLGENAADDHDNKHIPSPPASPSRAAQNLRQSIAGLENLMQEALKLAKDASDQNKSNEIPAILDEARYALHRASIVQDKQETAISVHKAYSISSVDSSCSSCMELNLESGPKVIPRRPGTLPSRNSDDVQATSDSTSHQSGPRAVWDEDFPHHRLESHATAVDWAYPRQESPSRPTPSRAVASKANRNKSNAPFFSSEPPLPYAEEAQAHIRQTNEPQILPRSSSISRPRPSDMEGANSPEPGTTPTVPLAALASDNGPPNLSHGQTPTQGHGVENWGRDKFDEKDYVKTSDTLKGKNHLTLKEGEHFSVHHGHVRQPIARNWSKGRKRFTAITACLNTALIGVLIGIYAGEVPAIQYTLADTMHHVILGNVCLYIGMAITTFLFWPLPLLHGRKPYTLMALGIALPLQIPQALIVSEQRSPEVNYSGYVAGLLLSRGFLGLALGFAHINFKSTLLDLYGASLQSEFPHGETVIVDDVRRHGGGMGYWLGIWSFSFIGSLALGFLVGADVIRGLNISWGFYICVILIAAALFLNVITPETRRSPHRRTMQEVELPNESISRRVARGEIKMHVSGDGPKWWWEEVFAGIYLSIRMFAQSGFFIMALYLAWIYAQIVLIIVLLGNLLSAEYSWRPEYVGLGVLSVAVGALLAVPNSKANFFSRSRIHGPRTDSMTFQPRFTWTSHCVRRALFMVTLPIAGLAYTLASKGHVVQYMVPIVFAGVIGYVSNLAIAECNGIIMENFDTSDLQPGTNSRHRLQSLAPITKRRRTTYSSYPRVSAGFFASQSLGFLFAAAATGVGGAVTRTVGAQKSTAITAGILLGLTLLLTCVLIRFRVVQVIPNELFGTYFGSADANRKKSTASIDSDKSWRAVVIGNPSGKFRRMNWFELGSLSRWTEIRRLNRLLSRSTTQALNPGWR